MFGIGIGVTVHDLHLHRVWMVTISQSWSNLRCLFSRPWTKTQTLTWFTLVFVPAPFVGFIINDTLGGAKSDKMPHPPRVFTRISYVFATSRPPRHLNCLKQSLLPFPEVAITSPGVVSHQWRRSTIGQLLTYEPSVTPARTFTSWQRMLVYQEIPEVISAYKPTRREKRDAARGLTTLGSRS